MGFRNLQLAKKVSNVSSDKCNLQWLSQCIERNQRSHNTVQTKRRPNAFAKDRLVVPPLTSTTVTWISFLHLRETIGLPLRRLTQRSCHGTEGMNVPDPRHNVARSSVIEAFPC